MDRSGSAVNSFTFHDYFKSEQSFTESLIEALLQRADEIYNTNPGIVLGRDFRLAESLHSVAEALRESLTVSSSVSDRGDAVGNLFVDIPPDELDDEVLSELRNVLSEESDKVLAELPSDLANSVAKKHSEITPPAAMFTRFFNFLSSRLPSKAREKYDGYARISKTQNASAAPVSYGAYIDDVSSGAVEASTGSCALDTASIQPIAQLPPYFDLPEDVAMKSRNLGKRIFNRMKNTFMKKKIKLSYVNTAFIPSDPMAPITFYENNNAGQTMGSDLLTASQFCVTAAAPEPSKNVETTGRFAQIADKVDRLNEDFAKTRQLMDEWSKL